MEWKWSGFPISIKVNSTSNPYGYTDYLLTSDPAGITQITPDWYWEVFYLFQQAGEEVAPGPRLDIVGPSGGTDSYDVLALTHWHSPSEHTVDGKHYDLELHFGMAKPICFTDPTSTACTIGVLALFFDTEAGGDVDDPFIANYQLAFDTRNIGSNRPGINLDLLADSLDMSEFWAYSGSATSPPCAEFI